MTEYLKKGYIALLIFSCSTTVFAQADSIDVFVKNANAETKNTGITIGHCQKWKNY